MTQVKVFLFLLCLTGIGSFFILYNPHYFYSLKISSWDYYPSALLLATPSPSHVLHVIPTNHYTTENYTTTEKPRSCSCEKCLTDDQELQKHRLDTFAQPLLSGKYKLSEENYNWWKHLQGENSNFPTFQTTMESLFQFFPPVPDLAEPKSGKCRSCAVVGNSPRLRGAHYGNIINSQDVVIRLNHGRVKGFEDDVGNKTTHRAMYPESAENLDSSTHLVLFAFKMLDLQWLMKAFTTGFQGQSYAPIIPRINANKDLVMVVNPAFMRYVHDKWLAKKAHYPSTGFMTVILALHICDEVHVFGFGADTKGHWSHYWESQSQTVKYEIHPRDYEYSVIEQLDKQGRLKFYKGV